MFTGLIQTVGRIESIKTANGDITLSINAAGLDLASLKQGDSIAVNGVCLTATHINNTHFEADVSKETLNVTAGLSQKNAVNLESALRLNDSLGGHLVSGHVDGIGEVMQYRQIHDCWLLAIKTPHLISKYIARKGSICVDGISLTINTIERDIFTVNIIPHTIEKTTLSRIKIGDKVNIEVDQIARYIDRMRQWENES